MSKTAVFPDGDHIVHLTYVGSLFSFDGMHEFRTNWGFEIPFTEASVLSFRHVGVLAQGSMAVTVPALEINERGFVLKFPQGDLLYHPEQWFWNFGPVQNEDCYYAYEEYKTLLPELRTSRKNGERGKAIGTLENWKKRKALEAWVYYYRQVEKIGHFAAVLKAIDTHPNLVPENLASPEDALLKSTKLNT